MTTLRILLIEDNPGDRYLVELSLSEIGVDAEVECITDGESACDHLMRIADGSAPGPDLMLLDINLPRVDGIGILTRIAKEPRLAHLPVVVLTTSNARRDREACLGFGAVAYLVKPCDYDDFLALMRQAVALARPSAQKHHA